MTPNLEEYTHSGMCKRCGKAVFLQMPHMAKLIVTARCSSSFSSCIEDVRYTPWNGDQEQLAKERTAERIESLEKYREDITRLKRTSLPWEF